MLLLPESGPRKNFRANGFTKTVTLHLRSIGPNVQRHMAYFAIVCQLYIKCHNRMMPSVELCSDCDSERRGAMPRRRENATYACTHGATMHLHRCTLRAMRARLGR
jgi:hypothetical protein